MRTLGFNYLVDAIITRKQQHRECPLSVILREEPVGDVKKGNRREVERQE